MTTNWCTCAILGEKCGGGILIRDAHRGCKSVKVYTFNAFYVKGVKMYPKYG